MLRIFTCILGVFMALGMLFSPAFAGDGAQITRLKNGLTVYILPDTRFPLVSTRLYVHAGSAYEQAQEAGISHVLEHMVFKGTTKRPKGIVARHVEEAGGYLNAATSFDYTVYLTDMPAAHWKLGMDVVKDMAFDASLDPAELESEKQVILAELQRGEDSPNQKVFKALQASTLKGTPYARPIIGYPETIKALTVENIRAYITKYYQPQSMLLVVVGNIDPALVLTEAERLFGPLPNTADIVPPQAINAELLGHGPVVTVQPGPWNKVYLGAAFPVPGDGDVRSIPLDVLSYLLGGDATSYLHQKYQYQKRLVDSIDVGNYTFERVGMLYFTVQLDADKLEQFWAEFCADMANLQADRFTPQELARARLNLEDEMQRTKETLAGLASWKGRLQFFLGGAQGEENIMTELRNVDSTQLQKALHTWVKPERLSVAVLPPKAEATAEAKADIKKTGAQAVNPAVSSAAPAPDLAAKLTGSLLKAWPAKSPSAANTVVGAATAVETLDLGHGRSLVLLPDTTLPYTAVEFMMPGGDALLPPNQQGLAALTARVLTSGTASMTAPELERYLSDRATSMSAVAGRQAFGLSLRQPTRFNGDGFKLMTSILLNPAFAAEEVAREKTNQIAAIRARDDSPLGLAFDNLPPFLFPNGHTYGYRTAGTIPMVEKYTATNIRHYWEQQIQQPWVMAVAGDFDRESVLAFARTLPVPKQKGVRLDAPLWGKKKALMLALPERNQAHMLLVFKTVPLSNEDAPALQLLQNILAGQSGLLFKELRDNQGLGYTVTAFNRLMAEAGYMAFYIGTEPAKLAQATEGFKKIISQLHTLALPAADLQSGNNQLEGDYYRARQSLGSRASEAAGLTVMGRPLSFAKDQMAKAKQLSPADLQKVAQKYLKFDQAYVVTVQP
ncbi:MAG: pitrilysin family protein [Desulfovibrionaceae bacterium]